jgi:hypothetical protein
VVGVACVDHVVRDPVGPLGIVGGPEIGVEELVAAAHGPDPLLAAFVDLQLADVGVPHVVLGEHPAVGAGRRHGSGAGWNQEAGGEAQGEREAREAHVVIIGTPPL